MGPVITPAASSTQGSGRAGSGAGKQKAQWDGRQKGDLSRRESQLCTLSPPVLTAAWDDPGQSKAHLTYLWVGGLAQWVVAMPEDRYLSLRRSMRRTFTKSLEEGGLGQGLPSPRCRGRRPA